MTQSVSHPLSLSDHASRHDGWTPARQTKFLRALAETHSVAEAARVAGMSRQSAYGLRARLRGEPFDLAWIAALRCRFDALAECALERAMHGIEVPHFYKGELIGTSRRHDERLTVALLAMRDRFAPPPVPHHHDASAYPADDFAGLIERIETGPETWEEERLLGYAAEGYGDDDLADEHVYDEGDYGEAGEIEEDAAPGDGEDAQN